MEVISTEVLACRLAETRRHMLNSADDLRDGAFVTYRAFCPALCYGHVLPWEHAALSKSPGFKASPPDWGLRIGPVPGNKELPNIEHKDPSDSIPPFYCPSLALVLYPARSLAWPVGLRCFNPQVGHCRAPRCLFLCCLPHSALSIHNKKAARIFSYTFQPS